MRTDKARGLSESADRRASFRVRRRVGDAQGSASTAGARALSFGPVFFRAKENERPLEFRNRNIFPVPTRGDGVNPSYPWDRMAATRSRKS